MIDGSTNEQEDYDWRSDLMEKSDFSFTFRLINDQRQKSILKCLHIDSKYETLNVLHIFHQVLL